MTLAVCSMLRNEAPYLLEWLVFHSLSGVELFRLYENGSDDDTTTLIRRYSRVLPIELVNWTEAGITRQAGAFADGLRSFRGRVDFGAFIDGDEFLFDPEFRPLPSVLQTFAPDVGAIGVTQRVFGSSGHRLASSQLITSRFGKRAADDYSEHKWFKTIARPDAADVFDTQHAVALRHGRYVLGDGDGFNRGGSHPGQSDRIPSSGLRLHHYMLKSLEEFRRKQSRGAVSDRPKDGYRRFTNDYFTARDEATNQVLDPTLVRFAEKVENAIRDLERRSAPRGRRTPAAVSAAGAMVLGEAAAGASGFCAVDQSGLAWIQPDAVAELSIASRHAAIRLQLRCYCVVPDYPLADVILFWNDIAVRFSVTTAGQWHILETEVVPCDGAGVLQIEPPFFLPARFQAAKSADRRNLAVAVSDVRCLAAPSEASGALAGPGSVPANSFPAATLASGAA